MIKRALHAFALASILAAGLLASAAQNTPDLSGRTDDSIRSVLRLVSRHQQHPLADGDYSLAGSDEVTLDAVQNARQPEGVIWNYPWGVTLYGVIRASDVLDDKSGLAFAVRHNQIAARDWAFLSEMGRRVGPATEGWKTFIAGKNTTGNKIPIDRLMRLGSLDSCGAMGVQILEALARDPAAVTPGQTALLDVIADWIVNKQERLPDGTLWRNSVRDAKKKWPPGTVWIDDLYMACPFLVRWTKHTGDSRHLDDAARQILTMAALLQDSDGLWFHAYSVPKKERSPVKWGRANGWAMIATVEVLSALPKNHPLRPRLLDILRRHIDGVKKVQTRSGLWRQVLNEEKLWEETSCSAMFAYCIARAANRGWISAGNIAVARKGFAGVCIFITPEGGVNGTCIGGGIGLDLAFYESRPRPDNDLHGRGAVLLAGAEILSAHPRCNQEGLPAIPFCADNQ